MQILLISIIVLIVIIAVFKTFAQDPPLANEAGNMPRRERPAASGIQNNELEKLKAWTIEKACEQCGSGIKNDPLARTRLHESAEIALQEIHTAGKAEINIPYLTADAGGPKHFNVTIEKEMLAKI